MRRAKEISEKAIEMTPEEFADFISVLEDMGVPYHHFMLRSDEAERYDDAINVNLFPVEGHTPSLWVFQLKKRSDE